MNLKIRPSSKARSTALLALALALFTLAAGCNKESNTGNSPQSAHSNNVPANASPLANTASIANTSPATAKPMGLSPTEAVKGYYEAGMRKDIAGVKRFLSRPSLEMTEEIAKRQGKTLDQLFVEAADKDARKPLPVFSNEIITGDTATVDIKIVGEPVLTMPLVKEEGEWKLAFGKPKSSSIKR
jgi:hypothetical protein